MTPLTTLTPAERTTAMNGEYVPTPFRRDGPPAEQLGTMARFRLMGSQNSIFGRTAKLGSLSHPRTPTRHGTLATARLQVASLLHAPVTDRAATLEAALARSPLRRLRRLLARISAVVR